MFDAESLENRRTFSCSVSLPLATLLEIFAPSVLCSLMVKHHLMCLSFFWIIPRTAACNTALLLVAPQPRPHLHTLQCMHKLRCMCR